MDFGARNLSQVVIRVGAGQRPAPSTFHPEPITKEPVFRVNLKDGKLVLERLKAGPAALEPAFTDVFTSPARNIRFTRNSLGKVTGLLLSNGRVLIFRFRKS